MSKKDIDSWKKATKRFRKSVKLLGDKPLSREELTLRLGECRTHFAELEAALDKLVSEA